MPKLVVPEGVIDGFIEIAKLSTNQIDQLADYLKNMPVGTKYALIDAFLNTQVKIENSDEVVKTLLSFSELLDPENNDFPQLSHRLTESIKEKFSHKISDFEKLESNLLKIFENSNNLNLTFKAFNLLLENENLYVNGKIITDIRLVFNENITDPKRNAVVLHKLHLNLQNNRENTSLYITLDKSDLKDLKDIIDRAILKEDIIREDYENITFLNN